MYSEENRSSGLAKFLSNYDYVYLDTCSLMEDGFPIFMDALVASKEYWKEGLRVIVPNECVKELKKHSKNKEKIDARIGAKRALKILGHDKWHGKTIEREKGITGGDFGDQAITQAVIQNRIRSKILVITQDKTLTRDLRNLNQLESQHGRNLDVCKITPNGELAKNLGESGYSRPVENKNKEKKKGFGFKKLFEKPQKKNTKEELPSSLLLIQEADQKLASALGNRNYPNDKRLADLNAQISALSRLSGADKKKLTLIYPEDRLLKEKEAVIKRNMAAVETKKASKQETHEHFEKPLPKKTLPEPSSLNLPKPEKGKTTVEAALKAFFEEQHVLVRDDSVPYFAQVHGPIDATNGSFSAATKNTSYLKNGEEKDVAFADKHVTISCKNGLYFAAFKTDKTSQKAVVKDDIAEKPRKNTVKPDNADASKKAAVSSKNKKEEATPVEAKTAAEDKAKESAEKKKAQGKKTETKAFKQDNAKKAPEKSESKGTQKNKEENKQSEEPKKETSTSKAKKAPSSKSKTKEEATKQDVTTSDPFAEGSFVLPQGVNLFVGEPSKRKGGKKAAGKIEKKDDRLSVEEKMDVDRYLKKEPAVSKKSEGPKGDHELLEKALSSEAKLNANINNSNYPLKNKIRDLETHRALVRKLSEKDRKSLKLKVSDIDKKLKELKKAS